MSAQQKMGARLAVAWSLVVVALGYGVVETLNKAAKLFTG